jgi:putative tryptophan/tyrosine transport system substrate-binding protein
MRKKVIGVALSALLLALCLPVQAQQPAKIPRIGYLASVSVDLARIEAFRQGLRELGYVEGKNIVIEVRSPEGKPDRLASFVAELVHLKVDVIVSTGSTTTRAAKEATSTIPIVMTQDPDPIGNGFVTSLARPGRNITGLSNLNRELSGKRLEVLKEVVPRLSRVAVFGTSTFPGNAQNLKETELAGEAFGVKVQYADVLNPQDIEIAFRAASKGRAEAVLGLGGPVLNNQRTRVVELAAKSRLPAMYSIREYVEAGGLMSYGVSVTNLDRRAATFVDKILKGTRPADIPVEQPTKFEFAINLKAAKQIGLNIPQWTLTKADKVIK